MHATIGTGKAAQAAASGAQQGAQKTQQAGQDQAKKLFGGFRLPWQKDDAGNKPQQVLARPESILIFSYRNMRNYRFSYSVVAWANCAARHQEVKHESCPSSQHTQLNEVYARRQVG